MKKKIDPIQVINELKDSSVFFQKRGPVANPDGGQPQSSNGQGVRTTEPSRSSPLPPDETPKPRFLDRSNERTNERFNDRTNGPAAHPPKKRQKTRHAFDIFADQLLSLKKIQLNQEELSGEKCSLGSLVQDALDEYISQHQKADDRTNERTNG